MIDNPNLSDQVQAYIRNSKDIVNDFYQVNFSYPVTLAKNTWEITKTGLLPWANSGIRKNIILKIPGITQDQITHEMSHFALRKITKGKLLPIWFDEGLACYVSNMDFGGNFQHLKSAGFNRGMPYIIEWKGLSGKFFWLYEMYVNKNMALIYGQSLHMMIYLLQKFTHTKLLQFINTLQDSEFDDSFSRIFGTTIENFYIDFLRTLK